MPNVTRLSTSIITLMARLLPARHACPHYQTRVLEAMQIALGRRLIAYRHGKRT
jgi:hypothetical protein